MARDDGAGAVLSIGLVDDGGANPDRLVAPRDGFLVPAVDEAEGYLTGGDIRMYVGETACDEGIDCRSAPTQGMAVD